MEVAVAHTLPAGADVLLHWGVAPVGDQGWMAPDPALWPPSASTEPVGPHAVRSKFPTAGGEYELLLKFPKRPAAAALHAPPAIAQIMSPPPVPDEVRFVVLRRDPSRGEQWIKQKCAALLPTYHDACAVPFIRVLNTFLSCPISIRRESVPPFLAGRTSASPSSPRRC